MTTTRRRTRRPRRAAKPAAAHAALPVPVRLTRVRVAMQRIAAGYYDRDDVRDRLATAVLAELRRP